MNTVLFHQLVCQIRIVVVVLTLFGILSCGQAMHSAAPVPQVQDAALARIPRGGVGGG